MNGVKVLAICKKQGKDTLKNKAVFLQFLVFPVIAAIMQGAVRVPGMDGNYFVLLFATMFVGMAPFTAMASTLSEEKEKNTWLALRMADVKPVEFLTGIGVCIFAASMLGALVFGLLGGYQGEELAQFVGIMLLGVLVSMLLGSAVGLGCKSQMAATSVTVPVTMLFSFLPMLGMFNDTVKKVSRFTWSQGMNDLLDHIGDTEPLGRPLFIILMNFLAAAILFALACRRGMKNQAA